MPYLPVTPLLQDLASSLLILSKQRRKGKLKHRTLPNIMAMRGIQVYVQRLSKQGAEEVDYATELCMHFKNTQPALLAIFLL